MQKIFLVVLILSCVFLQSAFALTKNVVVDYGADPADGNDDTIAFQSAFEWAKNNPGNLIYIPSGWYSISSELKIYDDTIIYGDGASSHLKFNYTRVGSSVSWNMISILGSGNNVHDLELIGKGSVPVNDANNITSGGSMIVLYGAASANNNIYNMRFLQHEGIVILATQYASTFDVYDNFAWMCNFEMFQARGGAHAGSVHDNEIRNTGDDALSVVWYQEDGSVRPYDIDIYLNELYDCDGGINISHVKTITVRNNFISNSQMSGIKVTYWNRGAGGSTTSTSFVPSDPADDITIKYNQIVNCGSSNGDTPTWEASSSNSIFLYGIINSDIFGNHIWRTTPVASTMSKTAIRLMDFYNVKVRDNTIDCNEYIDVGIALFNWITPTPVNNNNVSYFSVLEVTRNWVSKPLDSGFSLNPPSGNTLQNVTISLNTINDCLGSVAGWINNHINSTVSNNSVNNGLPIIY